jgi:pantoate--beta-alanine ligase
MEIIKTIKKMQEIADSYRSQKKSIACVPTMGFLHEGHLSLIDYARSNSDIVVTTLFVNPLQFAPDEDFEKYPRDTESDFEKAKQSGSDFIFMPVAAEMYSDSFQTNIQISKITRKFEGEFRPGHFDGVATVVNKLFNAVKPHIAVFGRKDYQQTLLIKQMVNDLNMDIDIVVRPTVREEDGLAKSSRNVYLNEKNRANATILYKALKTAEKLLLNGERERSVINGELKNVLMTVPDIKIDYAVAAVANNLDEPDFFADGDEIVLLIALHLDKTRLIDNLLVKI